MPMLDTLRRRVFTLSRELSPPLERVEAHETEAEEGDCDELDGVDDYVGDEGFHVARCVVALEDWVNEVRE